VNNFLKGQTAIVSGGLGDIGRAIAMELARGGAAVAVGDVRPESGAEVLLRELEELGARCRYDLVDVSDGVRVRAWVSAVEKDLGVPSLIIPNAATATVAGVLEITPDQWSRELRVNLDGAFHLAQAGAARLVDLERSGRIVFVGSWVGQRPYSGIPAYCVAKAGLRMLVQCMALELARHRILVNEVAPGYVDAGLSRRAWEKDPGSRERDMAGVPLHCLVQAGEVARQVVWLCHPDNLNVTGSAVLVDGGLSLL